MEICGETMKKVCGRTIRGTSKGNPMRTSQRRTEETFRRTAELEKHLKDILEELPKEP